MTTQIKNKCGDVKGIGASDKDIIYINQLINVNRTVNGDEERRIGLRCSESQLKKMRRETLKPSARSLLETIKR